MKQYLDFLMQQQERTSMMHSANDSARSRDDSWSHRTVENCETVPQNYVSLNDRLQDLEYSVSLMDFQSDDRFERRRWMDKLVTSYPLTIYIYRQGNYLGNLAFVWKLPPHDVMKVKVKMKVKELIPKYSSRGMRKDFIDRYKTAGVKPAILRDIYRYLTDDVSAAESSKQNEVDERVAKFLLECDDPDQFYDLRP
jgi:hypothetical protein